MVKKDNICIFCKKPNIGYGNSCWPLYNNEEIRCCNDCNRTIIIPKRQDDFFKKELDNIQVELDKLKEDTEKFSRDVDDFSKRFHKQAAV